MSVRIPDVAGSFYPADPEELRSTVTACLPRADSTPVVAALVPHAGYMYSGRVAGEVYSRIAMPRDVVLLCFHHRGMGAEQAVWPEGSWRTPLGDAEVPGDLAQAVVDATGASFDEAGHRGEHSGEVQIPFLQVTRPDVRVVPVALSPGLERFERLVAFGRNLASIDREFLVLASSDLNHYEPHEATLVKDQYVIDPILALDADGLRRALLEHQVSMCGYAPAFAMIAFARARGRERAELVDHKTSHDAGGDAQRTVGYAGILVK